MTKKELFNIFLQFFNKILSKKINFFLKRCIFTNYVFFFCRFKYN